METTGPWLTIIRREGFTFIFVNIFFPFSKVRKEENIKKDSKKVKNKLIKKPHSDEDESADEITSNVKQTKRTKGKHKDGSHMSSEEEVDISRGEGDMQSSSDDEDEENLRLEINKVWTYCAFQYHVNSEVKNSTHGCPRSGNGQGKQFFNVRKF